MILNPETTSPWTLCFASQPLLGQERLRTVRSTVLGAVVEEDGRIIAMVDDAPYRSSADAAEIADRIARDLTYALVAAEMGIVGIRFDRKGADPGPDSGL